MELIYSFDPERFNLGSLCKHGHMWPGTQQSLRRNYKDKRGRTGNPCVGCKGRKKSDWLLSFLDYRAMQWPACQTLGKLCPSKHKWNGIDASLRIDGRCIACDKLRKIAKRKTPFGPKLPRQLQRKLCKRQVRERNRALGLTSKGTPVKNPLMQLAMLANPDPEQRCLWQAIRDAGQCPTVAVLVMQEQRRYWDENPKAKVEHDRLLAQARWRFQYQTNPDLRLYTREKSRRRKAKARGQTPLQIPVAAIKRRFAEFGNCCAYCSATGDMNLEHVIPISKGGPHDIGNIIPACFSCNMSKGTKPMEQWYRQQPFFNEVRLQQIRRVMRPPEGVQLQLSCG